MANLKDVKEKVVTITLSDGVEREVKYDLNAMAEMEDRYGTIDAAFEALNKNSLKAVRFVLWVGLIHHDPSLTEQKVGSLIDVQNLKTIVESLKDSFEADMPDEANDAAVIASTQSNPNV